MESLKSEGLVSFACPSIESLSNGLVKTRLGFASETKLRTFVLFRVQKRIFSSYLLHLSDTRIAIGRMGIFGSACRYRFPGHEHPEAPSRTELKNEPAQETCKDNSLH